MKLPENPFSDYVFFQETHVDAETIALQDEVVGNISPVLSN